MAEVITLDDSSIENAVQNANLPVFIDLWAEWCVPCRKISPVIDELADEYTGKMIFSKLNVDENLNTADRYQIMSLPQFLILNNKMEVLEKFIGAVPKQKFVEKIESALKKV